MLETTAPDEIGYRSPFICSKIGITYRQLDYWARIELLEPSVIPAHGSGSWRYYSTEDVFKLHLVKTLLDQGVTLTRARQVLETHTDVASAASSDATLVLYHGQSQVFYSAEEIGTFLKGLSGCVLVLPLGSQWHYVTHLLDSETPVAS